MTLEALGWGPPFSTAFDELPARMAAWLPGRVAVEHRGRLLVCTDDRTVLAWPPEGARHESHDPKDVLARPRVGDWVALADGSDEPRIVAVLPRRTALLRQTPRRRVGVQVVAANLDRVFVVTAVGPDLSARRLERFVAAIRASGATPELIVNKVDLLATSAPFSDEDPAWRAVLAELGTVATDLRVHPTSTRAGVGVEALRASIRAGESIGLVGTSGAGKSSLVNALLGAQAQDVAEVREGDQKGRHTTTHRELVLLPRGGVLVDTPGMRELQLWDGTGVSDTFTDVEDLSRRCRWRGCTHGKEDGCAIQAAIRDQELDRGRYLSWKKLHEEAKAVATRRSRTRDRRPLQDD